MLKTEPIWSTIFSALQGKTFELEKVINMNFMFFQVEDSDLGCGDDCFKEVFIQSSLAS